ncbi:LysR substrate-binding domain-containing protein [Streptomyces sp. NPDC003401]
MFAVPLGPLGVTEVPLFDQGFAFVIPLGHRPAGREGIPREALGERNPLLLDEGHRLRDRALDICREAGRADAPETTTAAGLRALGRLVAGGPGRTPPPRIAAHRRHRRDRPRHAAAQRPLRRPRPTRRIALVLCSGAARGAERTAPADPPRPAPAPPPVRMPGADA